MDNHTFSRHARGQHSQAGCLPTCLCLLLCLQGQALSTRMEALLPLGSLVFKEHSGALLHIAVDQSMHASGNARMHTQGGGCTEAVTEHQA